MAKEKRTIKVRAKINLKYDKDVIKIGKEFLVRKADLETIKEYVEIQEEIKDEKDSEKDEDGNGGEAGE